MRNTLLIICALLCYFVPQSYSQSNPTVKLSVSPKIIKIKAGSTVKAKLTMKLPKSWHIYGIVTKENKDGIGPQATEITLKDSTPTFSMNAITSPKPKVEYDDGFEMDVETLEGTLSFTLPIVASPDATPGKYKPLVSTYFQMCDGKTCLTPQELTVECEIQVVK